MVIKPHAENMHKQNARRMPPFPPSIPISSHATYSYSTRRLFLFLFSHRPAHFHPRSALASHAPSTPDLRQIQQIESKNMMLSMLARSLSSLPDHTYLSSCHHTISHNIVSNKKNIQNPSIRRQKSQKPIHIDNHQPNFLFSHFLRTPQHRRRHTDAVLSSRSLVAPNKL